MTRLVSLFVLFGTMVCVSALASTNVNVITSSEAQTKPIATLLSQRIVDIFSTKLTSLARYFQLKIRIVRFLASLYTNQNLRLLRDVIHQGVRFSNFILKVMPQTINDPGFEWVMIIAELFQTSNATEELLGMFLGSQPVSSSHSPGEVSLQHHADQTDPPIFFNAAVTRANSDANEVKSAAKSTGALRANREVNKGDFGTEEEVMALDKLINAKRK